MMANPYSSRRLAALEFGTLGRICRCRHASVHHTLVHICEQIDGGCNCSLKVEPHHFNTGGIVHGGVAYTLADTAMGSSANFVSS